jgi:hypothetical protein
VLAGVKEINRVVKWEKTMETKRVIWAMWVMVCVLFISKTSWGKSVYAIASHSTSATNAYRVKNDGTIDFQTTVDSAEYFSIRATGLCVWPSIDRMFATYEDGGLISWGSTKTLTRDTDDEITTPEFSLAGIVADEAKGVLYVVSRSGGRLYTYTFDIENDTLVLVHPNDPAYPNRAYRQLEGLESSTTFGLALDDDGGPLVFGFSTGLLYITDGTSTVRYYNTLTWELEGTVNMGRSAVGIDVDGDGHLYAGGYFGNPAHNYLMRYDLNDSDPNTALTEKDMGYNITDIIVDRNTGILYTTTRQVIDGRTGAVEVYDPAYWDSADPNDFYLDMDSRPNFGGPAGIAIGSQYKPDNGMVIEKIDDVTGCVEPNDVYQYEIAFHAGLGDEPNVVITDKLPEGVIFVSAYPNDPNWCYYTDRPVHTYTWELGDVTGYDPNTWQGGDPNYYFTLTVQVNNHAEPAGILYNRVSAESDDSYVEDDEETSVCWWDGTIIYVDKNAPGPHIGTTWETAYLNLTDALDRAALASFDPNLIDIFVADGVYKPGTDAGDSFDVPDGIEVYGGYAGYGASNANERNWKKYETILSGFIALVPDGLGGYYETRNNIVVTMDGNGAVLNGFTVEKAEVKGIDGSGVSSTAANCIVKNNVQMGIYCLNGNLTVQWCEIKDNGEQGIQHEGINKFLTIENCKIHNNERDGIKTISSSSLILNSLIYQNGLEISPYHYYGINLDNPYSSPVIRNNTIVQNVNEGIRRSGGSLPDIVNCIVYYNGGNSPLAGLNPDAVAYNCCIADCNEVNNNFNDAPGFAYTTEPNNLPVVGNYHLAWNSPCVDTGDSDEYTDEKDIDGDDRVYEGTLVDRGADEVTCTDTSHPNDWNSDGVINMDEFAVFSHAWLSQGGGNDPNWNPACNLDNTGNSADVIDLADFKIFCENWLWMACWRTDLLEMQQQMMMQQSMLVLSENKGMMAPDGEGMSVQNQAEALTVESAVAVPSVIPAQAGIQSDSEIMPFVEEKSIEEQILDLQDSIEFLEQIWTEESDIQQEMDPNDWKEFMDAVNQSLTDLKTQNIQTE